MRDDDISLEEIGEMHPSTPDAGAPVFQAKTPEGSFVNFAFLEEDVATVRFFDVKSEKKGDFSRLMDNVLVHFMNGSPTDVVFANVITSWLAGRDLDDVVDGFDRQTVEAVRGLERETNTTNWSGPGTRTGGTHDWTHNLRERNGAGPA